MHTFLDERDKETIDEQLNNLETNFDELSKDIVNFRNEKTNVFYGLKFTEENSVAFDGTPQHFGNWFLSDFLDIGKYKYISVKLKGFRPSIAPVVFYDESKTVVNIPQESDYYIINGDYELECFGFLTIPNNAKYVRFNGYNDDTVDRIVKFYYEIPNPVIVAKDGTGDVFTINSAKNLFSNGSDVNIYLKNGIYEEVVQFDGRYNSVKVLGENRDSCVILDRTGVYKNSPFVVWGNFNLENITFKATIDGAGSWYPTYGDDVVNTYPSYALHIDGRSLKPNEQSYGIIRNCKMYSEAFPSVGMGLGKNQSIEFYDCEMVRNCTDDRYKDNNWKGAFLCHNSVGADDVENQRLVLMNNSFKSNYGFSCHLKFNYDIPNSQENFTLVAIGNVFYSDEYGTDSCCYEKGKSILHPTSKGNTSLKLNIMQNSFVSFEYDNIFDLPLNFKVGSLQNNTTSPSEGWIISPYIIPVLGSELKYYAFTVGGAVQLFVFYDENFNVVSSYTPTETYWNKGTYTVPKDSRIKYMRTCMNLSDNMGGYVSGKFKLN